MTKFLHTCVRVKDLEASLKFYKEALGFKEARRNDFPEYKFTLVYLQLEDDPDIISIESDGTEFIQLLLDQALLAIDALPYANVH